MHGHINWIPASQSPSKEGVYLVLRLKNRYPTSRLYNKSADAWDTSDVICYWAQMPSNIPEGYALPENVIKEPKFLSEDELYGYRDIPTARGEMEG